MEKDAPRGKAVAYHVGCCVYPSRILDIAVALFLLQSSLLGTKMKNDISSQEGAPPCSKASVAPACLVAPVLVRWLFIRTKASIIHRLSYASSDTCITVQSATKTTEFTLTYLTLLMPTMTIIYLNQLRYYAEHNPKTSTAILTLGTALSCGKMLIIISMTI